MNGAVYIIYDAEQLRHSFGYIPGRASCRVRTSHRKYLHLEELLFLYHVSLLSHSFLLHIPEWHMKQKQINSHKFITRTKSTCS